VVGRAVHLAALLAGRRARIAWRAVLGLLGWCLIMARGAAGAAVSGIPLTLRLRRVVRSRRARAARQAAEAELGIRLRAAAAALPTARLAFTRHEDHAVRPPRFAPRLFPQQQAPVPEFALRATLHVTAYFGTVPAPGDPRPDPPTAPDGVPDGVPVPLPEGCADPDSPNGPASPDSPDRPLRGRTVVHHVVTRQPPDATVASVRRTYGAVLRWESAETYLTVPRWPVLRRLAARRPGGRRPGGPATAPGPGPAASD